LSDSLKEKKEDLKKFDKMNKIKGKKN